MPHQGFLSYASADLAIAEAIHARLTASGLDIWFDKRELSFGDQWHVKIETACESSRVLLPVLTPRWRESEWTRYETYGAQTIIPLLIEGDFEAVAPPPIARWQGNTLPINPRDPTDAAWARLVAAILSACANPPADRGPRLALIQHSPSPVFVGRGSLLVLLHERLFRTPSPALTQGRIQAITGLGGMGKTTIARHYAEKFSRSHRQALTGSQMMFGANHPDTKLFAENYRIFRRDTAASAFPPMAIQIVSRRCLT